MARMQINTVVFFLLTVTGFMPQTLNAQNNKAGIESFVKKYETSINEADTVLASNLWLKASEISFIHPRGTEYGWTGIKKIYAMFGTVFSKRNLQTSNYKISVYGDVAWLTFEWVFDATMKQGNVAIQTRGRETQVLKKTNSGWKLIHVHYSGVPVTEQGKGF